MNFDVRLYMARAQIVGLARPPPLVPPLHSRLRLQPPREDGAEEAVASVPCRCELQAATRLERRVEALGWAQLEVGAVHGGEEGGDLLIVFLEEHRACRIHEDPAGLDETRGAP